jgi:hypothetical protein
LYGICSVPGPGREPIGQRGRCPLYYVPLWLLAVCLPVSALAIYLGLRDTGISRGLLYALTAVLSPVLLLGTAFAAVVASTALSAAFEEPAPAPQAPERPAGSDGARSDRTGGIAIRLARGLAERLPGGLRVPLRRPLERTAGASR